MPGKPRTVMAVGAHPDDVELFCGGTLAGLAARGWRAVILDLTRGEMGSAGTPAVRRREARAAAAVLGVSLRLNLDLGDARLEERPDNRRKVAAAIRGHRPDLLLAHHWEDSHPDHAAAGRLVRAAVFDASLSRLDLGKPPFAPALVLHFPGNDYREPTLAVDITPFMKTKLAAISSYRSQLAPEGKTKGLRPSVFDDGLWLVESRARHVGSLIRCRYAEGFIAAGPLKVGSFESLLG